MITVLQMPWKLYQSLLQPGNLRVIFYPPPYITISQLFPWSWSVIKLA